MALLKNRTLNEVTHFPDVNLRTDFTCDYRSNVSRYEILFFGIKPRTRNVPKNTNNNSSKTDKLLSIVDKTLPKIAFMSSLMLSFAHLLSLPKSLCVVGIIFIALLGESCTELTITKGSCTNFAQSLAANFYSKFNRPAKFIKVDM